MPLNDDSQYSAGSTPDLHPTVTLPESVIPLHAHSAAVAMQGSSVTQRLKDDSPVTLDHIPGYEISAAIGRGAMGVVYRAKQVKLQRLVALKVLVGRSHASAEDVARFNSEAVTIAQIQHPNVMQIYDVGEHNGIAYLAAEYIDGGTLESRMNNGKMPILDTLRLMYMIARGVGAAHSKGVVHRDLKPSNILLTADGVPKVADFGLAKQLGPDNNSMSGSVMGTPAYMAPEQAAGQTRRIGPQTDVYALGVILYQCLSGDVPLKGDSLLETLERIRDAEPLSVRTHRPEVPTELEDIVDRCLKKIPAERFPSADALAEELQRVTQDWETLHVDPNRPLKKTVIQKPLAKTAAVAPSQGGFDLRMLGIIASMTLLVFAIAATVLIGNKRGWFKPSKGTTIINNYMETQPTSSPIPTDHQP